jgi:hypothetical protein
MLDQLILTPPIAFLIILLATLTLSYLMSKLSYKSKQSEEAGKSYACGEDMPTSLIQPDYSAFFPFAFLFTILHVVALVVTTVPIETPGSFVIAVIYVLGAVTALFILFRR